MSVSTQTVQSLNSFFKEQYADKVENLIPEQEMLLKSIPFISADKQAGSDFVTPVILSRSHGVTFHGQNDNQLKLAEPIGSIIDQARIRSSAMTMRQFLSYTAAARAEKGNKAFVDATSYVVESLTESFSAIIEQTHWYGGQGLSSVDSAGSTNTINGVTYTFTAGVDATNNAIKLLASDYAEAIFCGGEGMLIDAFNGSLKVATTDVQKVFITEGILVLGSTAGIAAGYKIFRKGAKNLESLGLQYILQNQGNLFNIDASVRPLWASNLYNVSGNMSFEKVAEAVARAYGRGLNNALTLYVNPLTFSAMLPDFNTVKDTGSDFKSRLFTDAASAKTLQHGVNAIKFYVNSIEVSVVATSYCKQGVAFGVDESSFTRIGSTPMTFKLPGSSDGVYFRDLDEYAALELRSFADEALFCNKPARSIYFYGITNA
jgi:hypothetical protein